MDYPSAEYVFTFGPFALNVSERRLLRSGAPVLLSPKAFDVLLVLVKNQGRLVEKKFLMDSIWPDAFVEEGSVCVAISLLRKALGEGTKYIETVPKHGYRFVAEVVKFQLDSVKPGVYDLTQTPKNCATEPYTESNKQFGVQENRRSPFADVFIRMRRSRASSI